MQGRTIIASNEIAEELAKEGVYLEQDPASDLPVQIKEGKSK